MLGLILFLIAGGLAGMVAGRLMSGHGYGVLADVVLGILGGVIGGWLVSLLFGTDPGGLIGDFVVSLIGACILVAIAHMIKREPIRTR
ncbi:MAG TPA: GlsB/YeaQ/YmgE family stress response membrane protein [Candidatus Dormibacteraeota bacterium]|jgi:uncharacterized membrane protein YeaQ/YmgE (transglycosylase-associated protein family)|nr:GlsB/YeaQ/YmgE family stress response membrane protein [Candidatus Dormibacteraeota bacterium]